jgi:hypothetical protein
VLEHQTALTFGSALIIGLLLALVSILVSRGFKKSSEGLEVLDARISDLAAEVQTDSWDGVDVVRYYSLLDSKTIMNLYNQILPDGGNPLSRELEESSGRDRSAGLRLKWLKGSASSKDNSKTVTKYGPETEQVRALVQVERELNRTGKVQVLDLTGPGETKRIEIFIQQVSRRAEAIEFQIPPEFDVQLREEWNRQSLERRGQQISDLRGFVRVRSDFVVGSIAGNFVLESVQPSKIDGPADRVTITCQIDHVLDAGRAMFESGGDVRATCFGSVARWNPETRSLALLPICIYS